MRTTPTLAASRHFLLLCVALFAVCTAESSENVAAAAADTEYVAGSISQSLDEQTFAGAIETQNVIVFFQSAGCSLSHAFVPKFEQLAEQFADNQNVRFANVDCGTSEALCRTQNAQAYDIYLYPARSSGEPRVKFIGVRTVDGVARFVIKHLGDDALDGTALDVPRSTAAIIELTEETFKDHVAVGEHFVKFYAPWCGHCKNLAPTWDELATAIEADQSVSISKIDCTQHRPICVEFEVKGYPSLLWIVDGKRVHKYTGSRTIDALKAYVEETSTAVRATAEDATAEQDLHQGTVRVESGVLVLNGGNFEHVLERGVTFVKFYAPWCGHCKRMAPRWEELAGKFVGQSLVKIAKVDCTEQDNKDVCGVQEVNGFPTIFIYRDGQKLQEYNGNRSLEDLYEFVQRYASRDEL